MKAKLFLLIVVIVIVVIEAQTVSATLVTVPNGDFETGTPYIDGALPPWVWGYNDQGGNERFFQETRYGSTAPLGSVTYPSDGIYASAAFSKGGWAYNDLAHVILPNKTYTVSMDIRGGLGADDPCVAPTGWCGIEIYAGAEHTDLVYQDGLAEEDTNSTWQNMIFSFTTGAAVADPNVGQIMALKIVQQDGSTNGVWHYAYFDNVQVSYVPEPCTLFSLALSGLILRRRRKARNI